MGAGYGSDDGIVLADIAVIVGVGRCVHRLACDVEVACSASVGEDAEVTDAMHAVGDDVEQEASDELFGGDGDGAVARSFGLPGLSAPEGDGAAVELEDAAVGDGNPVGVARQVSEHLLWSAEGWFGVDDPVEWLRSRHVSRVVMEATGRYHRRVHQGLHDRGFEVVLINPLRARRFAEAMGFLAKTDRVDALMLARLGTTLDDLEPVAPQNAFLNRLEDLLVVRDKHVDAHTMLKLVAGEVDGEGEAV